MDNDSNSPTDASAQDQGGSGEPAGGSGGSGAQGGASSDAERFASERAALEAEARKYQSEADKVKAELARAQARIADLDKPAPTDNSEPVSLTAEQIRREALAGGLAAQEMVATLPTLKDDYPEADPAIFTRLVEFDSVESLRAAAEASHSQRKAYKDSVREAVEAEVRKELSEKYGVDAELRAPEPDGEPTSGEPTLEQLNEMSFAELQALEASKPGLIARISGAPAQGTTWGGGWGKG